MLSPNADTLERFGSVHDVDFLPVCACRGLFPWSMSASRSGANLLFAADFRVPVPMRNTVQLHVNHARTLICLGFSYMHSRERRIWRLDIWLTSWPTCRADPPSSVRSAFSLSDPRLLRPQILRTTDPRWIVGQCARLGSHGSSASSTRACSGSFGVLREYVAAATGAAPA